MKLSRPTVISYLRQAKAREIVSVRLSGEHFRTHDLADRLSEHFSLDGAYVIPVEGLSDESRLHEVCEAAAHVLLDFLQPGDQLGVSWGETLSQIADKVPYWSIERLTIRQLIGAMSNPLLRTAERCSTEIAHRLGALCVNLNVPAVCSNAALAGLLRAEPIIAEQLQQLTQCNKAIFSVSPCTPDGHVTQFNIVTEKEVEHYAAQGAVGIIAGRFIDSLGQPVLGEVDDRLMGIDLATLHQMSGLLVASGLDKLPALLAALKGGFANQLVIDSLLAEAILSRVDARS
ncbi:sugar-binding domain-containing protein [Acerihabitans sp. TG2]|uniref:sugar-binding transcriptional regulator n=1 Tax=Acerihabitans sp. TG2 TaxID=3096008 RepID=UPI002B233798|nr:sugar-binding domain-containing protein [Acerihabitans sp. TG2]MEA9390155.1 sugar-binding domain-containing protein [Acerihabitans sp. TG2]